MGKPDLPLSTNVYIFGYTVGENSFMFNNMDSGKNKKTHILNILCT